MKWARAFEILVGAVFLVAALGKSLDVPKFVFEIRAYGMAQGPWTVAAAAYAVIGIEAILGALLVAGVRFEGAVHWASAVLLAGMTALLAIGWMRQEPLPCGCFGVFGEMGRPQAMAKNAVFIAMLLFAWRKRSALASWAISHRARLLTRAVACVAAVAVVIAALATPKPTVKGDMKTAVPHAAGKETE